MLGFNVNLRLATAGIALVALLAGCASGPDIRADYDKSADFGKYRTYGFVSAAGTDTSEFKSLATQVLQSATTREMESRGYTRAENPDLVINFKGKLEEKTDIGSRRLLRPELGLSRLVWERLWRLRRVAITPRSARRYNVGTLVMDVVDREKRQVVFQGGLEDVVTKDAAEPRTDDHQRGRADLLQVPFVAGTVGTRGAPADTKVDRVRAAAGRDEPSP
jgi:hypothetical protein